MWTLQISLKEIDDHFTELFCIIETNVFLSFRCDIHLTDSAGVERGVAAPYGIKAALAYTRVGYKKCSHTTDFSVLLVLVGSLLLFVLIHACSFNCFMDNKSILTMLCFSKDFSYAPKR